LELMMELVKKEIRTWTLAIDPSPNNTSGVLYHGDEFVNYFFVSTVKKHLKDYGKHCHEIPKVKRHDEVARLERVSVTKRMVSEQLVPGGIVEYVGLEDYGWISGGKSAGVYQIGEVGGVLRLEIYERNLAKLRTYDPMAIKLARTGDGHASKEDMIKIAREELANYNTDFFIKLKDMPDKIFEHIADAMAISFLLRTELKVRRGEVMISDLEPHLVRVFNRVTKGMPMCILDRPFIQRV
jgi:Holliday junction resolvasome RuvABC endonuclease subunit